MLLAGQFIWLLALLYREKVDRCLGNGRRGRNRTCNPRIRNPMLYPFELRAPGSGNRKFNKGSSQSVVWGTTSEVPAQPQYRTASARRRV
jgi:hypothetical protein